jgi:DNA-binding beta-propeller fold protein YncE
VHLIVKTSESLEIKQSSKTLSILDANASGIPVYFTDGTKVYKGLLNDNPPAFSALPIGPFNDCYGLALDTINSQLYIADSGDGIIYKYDISSGAISSFRTGLSAPDALAIDYNAGKIYWDTSSGIQRTDLSSATQTDVEDFVTGQSNDPEGMAIDAANNKLYWINYDGGLWAINLDGSNKTQLLEDAEGGSVIVVDSRLYFDYYVASGDIHLKSTDLAGANMSTLTTGISKVVFGLGYDPTNNKIYWGDRNSGKIKRADLDGSNIETWYSASSPRGIVFGK